mmetsp:Transcript_10080/g.19268  ORF Transcript_10080/g.19268 Transcript_10080/m.19268 type:complete len:183 (-) Transcript_10080:454-1002(-)|eukprot:CAMPEP_0197465862 /NCGR_PEP_ID=MMETSP1175-20131217/64756_1 /TAXON_ID=1003142 /ORGANISM="Triceratium dubium, Strain CCMP147" /LENGTH=182 /DNA_ID=CAMNT_0043001885 /DNA_START=218 /DNA_END=766 /DNA_ORIENTATION=+
MPRPQVVIFSVAAAAAAFATSSSAAFQPSPSFSASSKRPSPASTTSLDLSRGIRHSALEDSPWETDPSYFDRLREAAKDPETFEAFVRANKPGSHPEEGAAAAKARAARDEINGSSSSADEDSAKPKKKKKGYQKIEQWDEEQRRRQDGSGMTWEEKVQFDGLRHGNGVRQNDILMHHLNSF